MSVLQLRKHTE